MQRTACLPIAPTDATSPHGWLDGLRRAWVRWTMSADERQLAAACDHADLEQRLRRIERGRDDRFGPLQEWRP